MNDELIKQCAREAFGQDCDKAAAGAARRDHREKYLNRANNARSGGMDWRGEVSCAQRAIRLYHARHVAPLVEAATEALQIAMEQSVKARAPECGKFGEIAQDLDAALAAFGKGEER